MAGMWMLHICAVLVVCMIDNVVFCNELEEPQNILDEELQGVSTDPQLVLELTASFASILSSLTKLENPQNVAVSPAELKQEIAAERFAPQPVAYPLDARDCNDVAAMNRGNVSSGIYMLKPFIYPVQQEQKSVKSFAAYCDMDRDGGRWTVIQRRHGSLVGFYRDWEEYKNGFGFLDGDHWLGLQRLHLMTVHYKYELRVDLEDFEGNRAYAVYDNFQIGDENTAYTLVLGAYRGTAGDSLGYHNGMQFSTQDRDNDKHQGSCAGEYKGAWWYGNCHYSNLNGFYQGTTVEGRAKKSDVGMTWYQWKRKHESLKRVEMKIRRLN